MQLFKAVSEGNKESVTKLLDKGIDVNCRDIEGNTPLIIATRVKNIDLVEILLEKGANFNLANNDKLSAMWYAIGQGSLDIVKIFHSYGEALNQNINGLSYFYLALHRGHFDIADYLIENGANINKQEETGLSPLMIACEERRIDIVKYLISNKVDYNLKTKDNTTALYHICTKPHIEDLEETSAIAKILIDNGAEINIESIHNSPLHVAAKWNAELVKLLVENNAKIEYENNSGQTAIYTSDIKSIEYLLSKGANINHIDDFKATPLQWAVSWGKEDLALYFVKNDASILIEQNNQNIIVTAVEKGLTSLVTLLLKKGVDVNSTNNVNYPIIIKAITYGHADIVKLLINKGVSLELKVDRNEKLIHFVRDIEILNILEKAGVDINEETDNGESLLWVIAKTSEVELLEYLISNGFDVKKANNDGVSPLMIAAKNQSNPTVIEILLKAGADINRKDNKGTTVMDYIKHATVQIFLEDIIK
jgi:ankyrin repeat protein